MVKLPLKNPRIEFVSRYSNIRRATINLQTNGKLYKDITVRNLILSLPVDDKDVNLTLFPIDEDDLRIEQYDEVAEFESEKETDITVESEIVGEDEISCGNKMHQYYGNELKFVEF